MGRASRRLYMQGKKQPHARTRGANRPLFNHALRHALKKGIMTGLAESLEMEILYGSDHAPMPGEYGYEEHPSPRSVV